MKYRLIWDDCTPTYERRPTTQEDIENDIHIEEFDDAEDLLSLLLDFAGYDEEEFEDDLPANATIEDKIKAILHAFDDPGDGSANILYISADGKEIEGAWPYDCLEGLDLEHCSEEDVKEAVMSDYDFSDFDQDFDPDDYYDYDQAVDYIEDHGVTCDGSTSVGGYVCDLLDEDYDEGEDYDTYYKQETLDRIIKLGQNEQIAEDLDLSEDEILSYKIQYNKGKINEEDLINDGFTKEEVQMILDYNDDLYESLNEEYSEEESDVFGEFLTDCLNKEYDKYEKTGSFSDIADDFRLFADFSRRKIPRSR